MTTTQPRVLVTGGGGYIGQLFRRLYGDRYCLRLTDVKEPIEAGRDDEVIVADLADRAAVDPLMAGVDAVVHLAAKTHIYAPWEDVLPANIKGTYHVFEAARRAGVRRIVYASSHHACGYALAEHGAVGRGAPGPEAPVRPDGLYGVSKVFGEALGRLYADEHGLSVVCLRIGWCHGAPAREAQRAMVARMGASVLSGLPYTTREQVGLWISPRDMAQLIHCSLQADVRFGIYYAASDNVLPDGTVVLDIEPAKTDLGYQPQDRVQEMLAGT